MPTPFNGDANAFIAYATDNPTELAEQLQIWALEWLEINCASWRWWQPTRRSLADIFGVDHKHTAGDVITAYEHFDKNPDNIVVANVTEKGERGDIDFEVVRNPMSCRYERYWGAHESSWWEWFERPLRQVADFLDARLIAALRNLHLHGRIHHYDVSSDPTVARLRVRAQDSLDPVAGWLISTDCMNQINGDVIPGIIGSPVVTAPVSTFSPTTCIVRSERLGVHFVVADSMRVVVDVIDDENADIRVDVWSGLGIDASTGMVRAASFDVAGGA